MPASAKTSSVSAPRRGANRTQQRKHTAGGEIVDVVSWFVSMGSGLAEARERAVHDGRIDPADGDGAETSPIELTGPRRFEKDIGRLDQLEDEIAAAWLAVVHRDAALAAVDGFEHPREAELIGCHPGVVASERRLYLDDLGAHAREQEGAVRTWQET